MKKFVSVLCALFLCLIISLPAVAAGPKAPVEIMDFTMSTNSVGGVSTTLKFRNNSGKQIKYIDVTVTAYNRVGDRAYDTITGNSTFSLRVVGPMEPFSAAIDPNWYTTTSYSAANTPFSQYTYTPYLINDGSWTLDVYLDKYHNFFVMPSYDPEDFIYLTNEEINYGMYLEGDEVTFDNIMYSSVVDHLTVGNVVVTYMDNSKQTISSDNVISDYRYYVLQNQPFLPTVARYSAVYNYNDYKTLNPDLVSVLGDNEKLLFEHFINNGVKEGRQGSVEFNLAAYKANNPDLVAAFGEDNVKYYEHFISSGKAEGRKAV